MPHPGLEVRAAQPGDLDRLDGIIDSLVAAYDGGSQWGAQRRRTQAADLLKCPAYDLLTAWQGEVAQGVAVVSIA